MPASVACLLPFGSGQELKVAAIDFLCVHSSLRTRRLAPVLIKEITRRCYRDGVYQAIYTSGTVLPKPVSTCRYYHRKLNWPKLYEVGFTDLPPSSRDAPLPPETLLPGLRPMQLADLPRVHNLFCDYLSRFDLALESSEEEARHWLMPRVESPTEQVVWTYVVEETDTGAITDFVSFFLVENFILHQHQHGNLRIAYLSYYASDRALGQDEDELEERLAPLVNDAVILAKRAWIILFHPSLCWSEANYLGLGNF